MVRHYRRKHLRDPGRRVAAAAQLRAEGLSLRQIAVSHEASSKARRDNAIEGAKAHFAAVLRAYQTVMPLLTDDVMTTAEALRRGHAA